MAKNLKQSNILLCGSSRVEKSTLINAICQKQLAKSNATLNSLTNKIDRYSYEYSNRQIIHQTVIWDTPGI
jgi:ribosome biogenesis GTPase A